MALLLQVAVLLVLLHNVQSKGLAANVSSVCTTGCSWDNPAIWDDGNVPTATDTVDIQISGTYTINVDTSVQIGDFQVGFSDASHGSQTFKVTNGATFASSGQATVDLSVTLEVDANSSFIITGSSTVQGIFKLYGFASFSGSSPSLLIDTKDAQDPVSEVTAKLELDNGVVYVANNLQISTVSTITGNGDINGTLQAYGFLQPGLNGIGQMNIYGNLELGTLTEFTVEIASVTSFDHIYVSQQCIENGLLTVSSVNSFEPLAHSEYVILNHTSQRDGFKSVHGSGFSSLFDNKWSALVDQSYTAVLYDSASSVLISFLTIGACLMATMM